MADSTELATGRPRSQALINQERVRKVESAVTGVLGAMIAKQIIRAVYRAVRKQDPSSVFDLESARFSWPDFVVWAVAGGIGLGIAKLISNRVAAIGWRFATDALDRRHARAPRAA
jgi:hypothetical protein